MIRPLTLATIVVMTVAILGGCDTQSAESSSTTTPAGQIYPNWPALLNNFRFHWSAEPGIDVTTGPAMVVRAYMEAYDTAWFTLNPDNVFPGFDRATPENQTPEGDFLWQLVHIRPLGYGYTKTARDARPHFGFQELHFLELTPLGEGYRAIVCSGEYAHFIESTSKPGEFIAIGVDDDSGRPYRGSRSDSGVFPYQIDFTQHDPRIGPNAPSDVTAPQRGPAPAPDQDVFGKWFFTGASSSYWGPSSDRTSADFPSPELQKRCGDAMPTPKAERLAMMTGFKDQPPPHGEAIPGWPAKSE